MVKIMKVSFDLKCVLVGLLAGFLICYFTVCRCAHLKEVFTNEEKPAEESKSMWDTWADKMQPTKQGGCSKSGYTAVDPIKQLEEGNMFMFNGTKFAQECCPSPYGSSTGCACMSKEQNKFLNQRGGNRTQPSVY